MNQIHRKMHQNENHHAINLKFCRTELFAIFGYLCVYLVACAIVLSPYGYRLPLNFYFKDPNSDELPFETWLVNYSFQFITLVCLALFFVPHFLLVLIIMNHTCCVVDLAVVNVTKLGRHLEDPSTDESSTRDVLKDLVEATSIVLDWQQEAKSFLKLIFFVELTTESSIICMCFYTVMKNFSGSVFVFLEIIICVSQLLTYCWMGSRVISQFDKLSNALYDIDWRLMTPKEQKDFQLILMMTQKFQGFDGIFKGVSLKSFKEVCSLHCLVIFENNKNISGFGVLVLNLGSSSKHELKMLMELSCNE